MIKVNEELCWPWGEDSLPSFSGLCFALHSLAICLLLSLLIVCSERGKGLFSHFPAAPWIPLFFSYYFTPSLCHLRERVMKLKSFAGLGEIQELGLCFDLGFIAIFCFVLFCFALVGEGIQDCSPISHRLLFRGLFLLCSVFLVGLTLISFPFPPTSHLISNPYFGLQLSLEVAVKPPLFLSLRRLLLG